MKTIAMLWVTFSLVSPVSAADPQAPTGLLVSSEEVAAVEAEVMKRLQEYRDLKCIRPVLRGEAEPGSGTDRIAAFGEGRGEIEPCFEFVKTHSNSLMPEDFDQFIDTGEGIPGDLLGPLGKACRALPGILGAAVARGDVCTPWRPGVRGNPSFMPLLHASKVSVILGRTAYRPEDALTLARTALDRFRMDQDTVRGGGTLIMAMISVASTMRFQAPWLTWILERADLDAAGYAEIADALEILSGTEPRIGTVLEADSYWSYLQILFPLIKGPDWIPPGGWDDGHVPVRSRDGFGILGTKSFVDEITDASILIVAMHMVQSAQIEACPVDASPLECMAGLRRHVADVMARNQVGAVRRVIRILAAKEPHLAIRQWIVDILMAVATPAFDKYVEKYAQRVLRIAQLRIHASVLREWAETGNCREDFAHDRWATLTRDPVFGGSLGVTRDTGTGEWVIRAAGTFQTPSVEGDVEYRFECPPGQGH